MTTSNFTYTGLVNGDLGTVLTPTANFGALDNTSNVGTYTNAVSATFSAANYNVTNTPTANLVINKRNVTATVASKSRAYGDANPIWAKATDIVYTNLVNGDLESGMDTVTFTATTPTATSNAGTTQSITITSFLDNNYNLTTTTAGTFTINKRDITAIVGNTARAYGDANPTLNWSNVTWSNLANSETGAVLDTLTVSAPSATNTSNAGTTHTIAISGFNDNNYNLLSSTTGTLSIVKRDITASINNSSRIYGAGNPSYDWSNVVWGNLANSETGSVLDSMTFAMPSATSTSNAGTNHIIFISAFNDNNYNLLSQTSGNLAITKALLTATVQSTARAYGDINPVFNIIYSGFANLETQSVIDTLATATSAANQSANAGSTQAITASGAVDNNYDFVYVNGTLTINKRDITGVVASTSRAYGAANPVWNWSNVTWNNLANSETGIVLDTLTVSAASATNLSNAGTTHAINISGFSDNNYNLTGFTAGTLTINKADLTLVAADQRRRQGEANMPFTFTVSGLQNGDLPNLIVTNAVIGTTANQATPMGRYAITITGAQVQSNYQIANYIDGELTITQANYVPPSVERAVQDSIQITASSQPSTSGPIIRNSSTPSSSSPNNLDIKVLEDEEIIKIRDGSETSRALIIISESLLKAINRSPTLSY